MWRGKCIVFAYNCTNFFPSDYLINISLYNIPIKMGLVLVLQIYMNIFPFTKVLFLSLLWQKKIIFVSFGKTKIHFFSPLFVWIHNKVRTHLNSFHTSLSKFEAYFKYERRWVHICFAFELWFHLPKYICTHTVVFVPKERSSSSSILVSLKWQKKFDQNQILIKSSCYWE